MPLILPTVERIVDVMVSRIQGSPGLSRLGVEQGGPVWQLANAFAREGRSLLVRCRGLYDDWFPTTATGDALRRWSEALLETPLLDPVQWVGTVTFSSTSATAVQPSGSTLTAADGTTYTTTEAATSWGTGPAYSCTVAATSDDGAAANKATSTSLTVSAPGAGVSSTATLGTTTVYGADAETESGVQQRIRTRLRDSPGGGNAGHYRLWAQQTPDVVSGSNRYVVEDAFIYPRWQAAGATSGNFSVWVVPVGPAGDRQWTGAPDVRQTVLHSYDAGYALRFQPLTDAVQVRISAGGARAISCLGMTVDFTVVAGLTTVAEITADLAADPLGVTLLSLAGSTAGTFPGGYAGTGGWIELFEHAVRKAVQDQIDANTPIGTTAYVKPAQFVDRSFDLTVVPRPGWEEDYYGAGYTGTVTGSVASPPTLNVSADPTGKILPGDRVVFRVTAGRNLMQQSRVSSVTAATIVIEDAFDDTPVVGGAVLPGGPLWQPIYDALEAHLESLGASREDATAYLRQKRRWPLEEVEMPSTIRLSDLHALIEAIEGVESVTFTTPAADVTMTVAEAGTPSLHRLGNAAGPSVVVTWAVP